MISLPIDMDIPETRRDTSKSGNVHWLMRNLGIRNRNHKDFNKVIKELKRRRNEEQS